LAAEDDGNVEALLLSALLTREEEGEIVAIMVEARLDRNEVEDDVKAEKRDPEDDDEEALFCCVADALAACLLEVDGINASNDDVEREAAGTGYDVDDDEDDDEDNEEETEEEGTEEREGTEACCSGVCGSEVDRRARRGVR
jgi:hypothetical protein